VVVNPPRRGIGEDLAGWLESSGTRRVLYSSCNNVSSLARDLERMPSLRPRRALLLDMFPNTRHHELLVLLERC
jgi:23S rRNA (uracil747-C5)-methyltransferase